MSNTEAITFVLDAEDEATAKIRSVTENLESQAKSVRDVGSKAKASTELVGTLANAMGGAGVGAFAAELAGVTERISAFAQESKGATAGAVAMKAGIVAAVGIMAFKVGNYIGDLIFQTEKYKRALQDAAAESSRLSSVQLSNASRRISDQMTDIGLIIDPEEQQAAIEQTMAILEREADGSADRVRGLKKQIEELQNAWWKDEEAIENSKAQLDQARAMSDLYSDQLQTMREQNGERAKETEAAKEEKAKAESAEKYVESLREQTKLMAMTTAEQARYNAEKSVANEEQRSEVIALIEQQEAIKAKQEAEQKAADEAKKARADEIAERTKIQDLQQSTLDNLLLQKTRLTEGTEAARRMQLEMSGLGSEFSGQVAEIESILSGGAGGRLGGGSLTGQDQRLLTGRASSSFAKTKEDIAEQQRLKQIEALEKSNVLLAKLATNQILQVVGN